MPAIIRYGSLIDNLHVAPEYQHSGVGRQLMELGRTWLAKTPPECRITCGYLLLMKRQFDFMSGWEGKK
ncbi:MAG: GNAT family N-acetyltransferase [Lewinellaceae bacterium]|nr:GNAT family N-acetyltransferase [Lewinellaceae bacterium]